MSISSLGFIHRPQYNIHFPNILVLKQHENFVITNMKISYHVIYKKKVWTWDIFTHIFMGNFHFTYEIGLLLHMECLIHL